VVRLVAPGLARVDASAAGAFRGIVSGSAALALAFSGPAAGLAVAGLPTALAAASLADGVVGPDSTPMLRAAVLAGPFAVVRPLGAAAGRALLLFALAIAPA